MKLILLSAIALIGSVSASATPVTLENGSYTAGECEYTAENDLGNGTLFTRFYCEITDTQKYTIDRVYIRTDDFHFQSNQPKIVINDAMVKEWNRRCKPEENKDHHRCSASYTMLDDGKGNLLSKAGDEFLEINFIDIMNPQAFRAHDYYRWTRNGAIVSDKDTEVEVKTKKSPVCK